MHLTFKFHSKPSFRIHIYFFQKLNGLMTKIETGFNNVLLVLNHFEADHDLNVLRVGSLYI